MNKGFSKDKKDAIKKALLESLSHGATAKSAYAAAKVSRSYYYTLLSEDAVFRNQVKDCDLSAIATVEDALWLKAIAGHPATMFFYLCNRAPDRWRNPMKPDIITQDESGNSPVLIYLPSNGREKEKPE